MINILANFILKNKKKKKKKKKRERMEQRRPANFILKRMLEHLAPPWDSAVSQLEIMPDEASFWIWISQFSIRS